MATLDEFLQSNPELTEAGKPAATAPAGSAGPVTLHGILVNADAEMICFAHLGHRFDVARSDVIDVAASSAAIPNPFGQGATVALTVGPWTRFRPYGAVTALSLTESAPFAIAQPSQIPDNSYPHHTAAELAWLAERGIADTERCPVSSNSGTYCGHNTTSPKWSGTHSNGREDDGRSDEYYGDDATHDDSRADD